MDNSLKHSGDTEVTPSNKRLFKMFFPGGFDAHVKTCVRVMGNSFLKKNLQGRLYGESVHTLT